MRGRISKGTPVGETNETKSPPPAPCFGPAGSYQLDADPLDAVVDEGGDWAEGF